MPLIPDGKYKIISVKYSPPSVETKDVQVADLIDGGPGPIAGRRDAEVHNDQWVIWNKYNLPDSNSVTIESVKASGTYAYADTVDGTPVVGKKASHNDAIVWTIVDRKDGKYNIQYPTKPYDDLLWELKEPNQNIKLGSYNQGSQDYNEWRFQPVP